MKQKLTPREKLLKAIGWACIARGEALFKHGFRCAREDKVSADFRERENEAFTASALADAAVKRALTAYTRAIRHEPRKAK